MPATVLFGRNLKTHLPEVAKQKPDEMRNRDAITKEKMKLYVHVDNKQYIKPSPLQVGDPVLVHDANIIKGNTPFDPVTMTVMTKKRFDDHRKK